MRYLALILVGWICLFSSPSMSQQYNPLESPNRYASKENPNYWKNRLPFEGYWQQDVHYTIAAEVDDKTDIISGNERLVYTNNSPDELDYVFFHLYQNAFQPDSYLDNLNANNDRVNRYGKYESEKKGTEILGIKVDKKEVKTELDNTLLKVYLPKPLKSGESIEFDIQFKTYFDNGGNVGRRMQLFNAFGSKHYNGVHWYPRISVYDRKFGWTTDQHLGHEFYGDFGTFDVDLTFPQHFVLDATGFLLNRQEVLPADLRAKLDIKNFKDKPWNSPPSEIIPVKEGATKTWRFHAENVHDFAFTADPTYRIGEATWNGITCYALVQEPHASKWQNAAQYTTDIIRVYSEDFGMYTYHKMIVADARDGMEYPMLTLDGGGDPGYRGLLAHEVGHNWFFGQVGNNEAYRPILDEGFTQFLTAWCLKALDGDTVVADPPKNGYKRAFKKPDLARYSSIYYPYLKSALTGRDAYLNTHSDGFDGNEELQGSYGQVYFKTATMLYNLQYVLGDELFSKAMKHYFEQWKIAHPYPEDFRASIMQAAKTDLNWFFDQWLETTKKIDYSIHSIKRGDSTDQYQITFQRKGRMQMPIDFEVQGADNTTHAFHIPNTWFVKETSATVLPKWTGWDDLHPTYEATVTIPGGIKEVAIDPSGRLADYKPLNNRSKTPVSLSFDSHVYNRADHEHYELFARPDLWYNGFDGLKAGVHINGNYMDYLHVFDLTTWVNTGILQEKTVDENGAIRDLYDPISFRLNYRTATNNFSRGSSVYGQFKNLDGLWGSTLGIEKKSKSGKTTLFTYAKTLYRAQTEHLNYLLYSNEWNADQWNNTINVGMRHNYRYSKGRGQIGLRLHSTSLESDYQYAYAQFSVVNKNNLGKLKWNTRTFLQYGSGGSWAPESQLFLAGANPEAMMDNKYTRSRGWLDSEWLGHGASTNHFQYGGGLNLRGYAGYIAPFEDEDGVLHATYAGQSGAAFNTEIEFNRLIPFNPRILKNSIKLTTYLFGDAGVINYNAPGESLKLVDIRADAGVGSALTIRRWGPLSGVKPLTVRFDMPLFLNTPPAGTEFFEFRWLIGINRAF